MKQPFLTLSSGLLLCGAIFSAQAVTPQSPTPEQAAATRQAQARYTEDKQLCDEETSSNARLQCRRDAKAEYDKAIKAAKNIKTTPPQAAVHAPSGAKALCADCGKVLAVTMSEKAGEGGPVGMIAGGVTGAILGRQVGGGMGKDLATIAGAAGGAYAGKMLEEKIKTRQIWTVSVQYADGQKSQVEFEQDPGMKVGDVVKKSGNGIVRE